MNVCKDIVLAGILIQNDARDGRPKFARVGSFKMKHKDTFSIEQSSICFGWVSFTIH